MIDLRQTLERIGRPKILVLGDAILDCYTWGIVERISPEAPVPVLRATSREIRPGGAASVAALLRGLEADVVLASVVGPDHEGRRLRFLLTDLGIETSLLLVDEDRETTTKERFLGRAASGHAHQILRVDHESCQRLPDHLEEQLIAAIGARLHEFQAVLVADYGKGFCTAKLMETVIVAAKDVEIPVLVDPARGSDFSKYRGASLLKPNRLEASLASNQSIVTTPDALQAAECLRATYSVDTVVVTLDQDGMVFASHDEQSQIVTTRGRTVCDITGAGDMVLAGLGIALAAGLSVKEAAEFANCAAGLEVEHLGIVTISRQQIQDSLDLNEIAEGVRPGRGDERSRPQIAGGEQGASPLFTKRKRRQTPRKRRQTPTTIRRGLISLDDLIQQVDRHRRNGERIVFTNGCFDLFHAGHLRCLEEASSLGDVLIVAINSDASVRQLKGPERPIVSEEERAALIQGLSCVDYVLVFDEPTPCELLERIKPDLLVKGGTTGNVVGREIVEQYGGRVVVSGLLDGWSTTNLVTKIRQPR